MESTQRRQVTTTYQCPPIPIRSHDWMAYIDPESGPFGHGATEEEAVADLMEQLEG